MSEKLKELLNRGIAREIQVSVQYMWQHVLATGIRAAAIEDLFKEIAITEMKHAEAIAERLAYLGGDTHHQARSDFRWRNLRRND